MQLTPISNIQKENLIFHQPKEYNIKKFKTNLPKNENINKLP